MRANEIWAQNWGGELEWKLGSLYEKLWHVIFGMGGTYCPSQDTCHMEHFSNAIVCAGDQDLTHFDGNFVEFNTCRSAYDGVPPDQEANLTVWEQNIVGTTNDMRIARAERLQRMLEREGLPLPEARGDGAG